MEFNANPTAVFDGECDGMLGVKLFSFIGLFRSLKTIKPGTFKKLNKLATLSISFNPQLMSLNEDVFRGLYGLVSLQLSNNGFNEIKDFSTALKASFMPMLTTIILTELHCPRVEEDDFAYLPGSKVRNIFFDGSQINYIHPDAFIIIKDLRNLSVSDTLVDEPNVIEVLQKIYKNKIPLMSLKLKLWGNKTRVPRQLFNVIGNTMITELILNGNQFDIIEKDTFPKMPNINTLILEESKITDIKENALINFPNLKQLHLKENKMDTIPLGVSIGTLEILDISRNTKPESSCFSFKFDNMTSLKILDLSYNNIIRIYNRSLHGLPNLKKLNLFQTNILLISNNSFKELRNLEYLDLGGNDFPQISWVKNTFTGLIKLKYLSLEKCNIKFFPSNDIFENLASLQTLNLRNNFLVEIPQDFMISMSKIKVLDLANNQLQTWQERLFINTAVKNLIISRNPFTHLTKAMLQDIADLKVVDVSNNPFHCECDQLIQIKNSLTDGRINHILSILNQTNSFCVSPETDKTIVEYYLSNLERCSRERIIKVLRHTAPLLICGFVLLTISLVSYNYRSHIRYWIFLLKLSLSRKNQLNKKRDFIQRRINYIYDAIVSYSDEDRNFVIRLVNMLESYDPFLKLCVYGRDFESQTNVFESVLKWAATSRKTLFIISNSYINSEWSAWEAAVAENHRLFLENDCGECVND
ncbi:toll-like receptor 3 [Onthophagus taurus]|uniref:toll-like receptor 3 n=1 Tax=Onthophagus taurus TaxID=166361 RepID=UPI0039BE8BAE